MWHRIWGGWCFKEFTPPRYNGIHFRGFPLPLAPLTQKLEFQHNPRWKLVIYAVTCCIAVSSYKMKWNIGLGIAVGEDRLFSSEWAIYSLLLSGQTLTGPTIVYKTFYGKLYFSGIMTFCLVCREQRCLEFWLLMPHLYWSYIWVLFFLLSCASGPWYSLGFAMEKSIWIKVLDGL